MEIRTPLTGSVLEPPLDDRRRLLDRVAAALDAHAQGLDALPVAPTVTAAEVRENLARYDFRDGGDADEVLSDVVEMLTRWTVHTTSPRYFGLFNPAPTWYGVLADTLVAGFNPQLAAWSHAPAAAEIEAHVLRFLGGRLGFRQDDVVGSFTTGGAEANLTGVLLALTRCFPAVADDGVRALSGSPRFYASAESHLAWVKIAHMTGLGRRAVRLVPVRDDLALDTAVLAEMITEDRAAGHLPFLVVATAGTTSAGTVDPLPEIADLCAATGLRLHVDAAWAGAAALSDRLRPALAGIERADSVTVDAHKWLSVPMGAGMFVCTDADALRRTFRVSTAYMPAGTADAVDPYASSVQWSRRFIGLKLFLTLAVVGRTGYARQLEHDADLGDLLRDRLSERGWAVVNHSPLPVVCFVDARHRAPSDADEAARVADTAAHHDALAAEVVGSGAAWISATRLAGRPVLRACLTSYRTTEREVDDLIDRLDEARRQRGSAGP